MDRETADILVRRIRPGEHHGEHAIPEGRARLVAVDAARQADPPFEAAVAALRIAALLVRQLGPLLTANGEHTFLDLEIDILLVEAGQLGGDADFLVALG